MAINALGTFLLQTAGYLVSYLAAAGPAYSTTKTPDNPNSWSAPKRFYPNGTPGFPSLPIDYWPIADDKNFYLFFTGDDGKVYRVKTSLSNFPNGFGSPTVVKTLGKNIIFEGSSHYKIKGTANTYLRC